MSDGKKPGIFQRLTQSLGGESSKKNGGHDSKNSGHGRAGDSKKNDNHGGGHGDKDRGKKRGH